MLRGFTEQQGGQRVGMEGAGVKIAGNHVTEVMGLLHIIVKILAFILSDVADTKGFEPRRDAVSGLTGALWLQC